MTLKAISPLDGRYRKKVEPLADLFSEFALIRYRCKVELAYLSALDDTKLFPRLNADEKKGVENLLNTFSEDDAKIVKQKEDTVKHDVKALEYFLRDRLHIANPNMIHFGLTSEDVNNLSYSIILKGFLEDHYLPRIKSLVLFLCGLARRHKRSPFPTRTHGQLASPSTAGKEIAVFISRLLKLVVKLKSFKFSGKLNGAVGNYSAMSAAFPRFDWEKFSRKFVRNFGLDFNRATTQIEDHDNWAEFFNLVRQINNVILDLDQDLWNYLMLGLFTEQAFAAEVGSSTMPHKINPIRFENSEGNLFLANSLLIMLSEKLCRSRMQRDLSDSTVSRNIGVALSHSYLAINETLDGLKRIRLNPQRCLEILKSEIRLLAEPIQTILRVETKENPYEWLKMFSRGKMLDGKDMNKFIETLPVNQSVKSRMKRLRPEKYIGAAVDICEKVLMAALKEVSEI